MIYLDCSSGMSGDMFAAALAGLGAKKGEVISALKPIARVGYRRVKKKGTAAVKFDATFQPDSHDYVDLVKSVKRLRLKPKAQSLALRILSILAEAESKAHDIPVNKVHLHEAADCAVDAVAAAVSLEGLGLIDEPVASSVISCGMIAPATRLILEEYGIPVRFVSEREILTPTGAAILASLDCEFGEMGYTDPGVGAGSMELPWPNILRVSIVLPKVVLESNIDDCTPEHISHLGSSLMDLGALDVHVIPCMMKKGRIGFLVRVLTDDPEAHAATIMAETGSLGVRVHPLESRYELPRRSETVNVKLGGFAEKVRVKFSPLGYKPEFDDVSALAKKRGLTFSQVREAVSSALSRG
ncbi:MAG: LarC family nickel insertion protein [Candidatus Altiarchaeota archaeon]